MLPNEIAPFADAHIESLDVILADLEHRKTWNKPFTLEEVNDWSRRIADAKHALVRFKVCMADEVKQKERYAKYAQNHGYPYS